MGNKLGRSGAMLGGGLVSAWGPPPETCHLLKWKQWKMGILEHGHLGS